MSRPLLLVLALALGCAMRGSAPEEAGGASYEPAATAPTATSGADEAAPAARSEGAYEAEAPPPSAPAAGAAPRTPQAVITVETVDVGRASGGTMVGGNASAGRAWARLVDTEDALHDALGLASVDCGDARDLRDRICELGERICDLADDSDDEVTADRCEDGRARCERARRRVADRCE